MQLSSVSSLCLVSVSRRDRWLLMDRRVVIRLFCLVPSQLASQHPRATSGTITPKEVDGRRERCGTGDESVKNFNDRSSSPSPVSLYYSSIHLLIFAASPLRPKLSPRFSYRPTSMQRSRISISCPFWPPHSLFPATSSSAGTKQGSSPGSGSSSSCLSSICRDILVHPSRS